MHSSLIKRETLHAAESTVINLSAIHTPHSVCAGQFSTRWNSSASYSIRRALLIPTTTTSPRLFLISFEGSTPPSKFRSCTRPPLCAPISLLSLASRLPLTPPAATCLNKRPPKKGPKNYHQAPPPRRRNSTTDTEHSQSMERAPSCPGKDDDDDDGACPEHRSENADHNREQAKHRELPQS